MQPKVTIVIPTFNRAHILDQTIPSYIQPEVGEIILIDDCSTDSTQQIVENLQKKYSLIRYLRNDINSKQGYTKNRGIEAAQFEYIYFGDDDSYILEGTIAKLLDTLSKYNADIVGAQAIYANHEQKTILKQQLAVNIEQIIDLTNLKVDFSLSYPTPIEVPFVQACFIISTNLAKQILFDENYKGNAYREETDFLIRASLMDKKIVYDSSVVQINLPHSIVKGGAHSGTSQQWYNSARENNKYFLDKNYAAMQKKWNLPHSKKQMCEIFDRELQNRYKMEHRYDWMRKIGIYKTLKYIQSIITK